MKTISVMLALASFAVAQTVAAQQPPPPNQPYGGLAPPPSGPAQPPPTQPQPGNNWQQPPPANGWQQQPPQQGPRTDTERALRDAEEKDAHRGLEWFALEPEVGLQQLGLTTFSGADTGSLKSSGVGPLVGAVANVRLLFVTIGVRGRVAFLSDFKYWTLGPELGFHMPIGNIEPHVFLGGGYAALAGLPDVSGLSVHGFDVRLGVGLDYYVSRQFSVGGLITTEILPMTATAPGAPGSSSTGFANAASLVLGLHL